MQHNHDLAIRGRSILCEALSLTPPCPDEMGCIATLVLPLGDDDGGGA